MTWVRYNLSELRNGVALLLGFSGAYGDVSIQAGAVNEPATGRDLDLKMNILLRIRCVQ
jgi:hypothetical protein